VVLCSEANRNVGTNNDGSAATPKNDDDPRPPTWTLSADFLFEQVTFSSANVMSEAVSGTGDGNFDVGPDGSPRGIERGETDPWAFEGTVYNQCP
jgi:hypothetical protein